MCPTGIDIRNGQQEGCITCALCIDACDAVMDKIHKPRGLVRYTSLDEMNGHTLPPLYRRPRVIVYVGILIFALSGIAYGLTHLGALELKVLHERQPLFVVLSDGAVQNKYELKVLNKTESDMTIHVAVSGPSELSLTGVEQPLHAAPGRVSAFTVFVRVPQARLMQERTPVTFTVGDARQPGVNVNYQSMFFGPAIDRSMGGANP